MWGILGTRHPRCSRGGVQRAWCRRLHNACSPLDLHEQLLKCQSRNEELDTATYGGTARYANVSIPRLRTTFTLHPAQATCERTGTVPSEDQHMGNTAPDTVGVGVTQVGACTRAIWSTLCGEDDSSDTRK